MEQVGRQLCPPAQAVSAEPGAPTDSFAAAQHYAPAPLSALGCFRLGEDGRLYFAGKSEHYHIPLGHGFPGYALLDRAHALGIPMFMKEDLVSVIGDENMIQELPEQFTRRIQ